MYIILGWAVRSGNSFENDLGPAFFYLCWDLSVMESYVSLFIVAHPHVVDGVKHGRAARRSRLVA